MSEENIIKTLELIRQSEKYNAVQIMFHSFSFIDQGALRANGKVLYQDGNKYIYGEDTKDKEKFEHILEYVVERDQYEVITFEEYMASGRTAPPYTEDNLIYLDNAEMAMERGDILVYQDENGLQMMNMFEGNGELLYGWEFVDLDSGELVYSRGYTKENHDEIHAGEMDDGLYAIRACIKRDVDDEKNTVKLMFYNVAIEDGKIVEVTEQ